MRLLLSLTMMGAACLATAVWARDEPKPAPEQGVVNAAVDAAARAVLQGKADQAGWLEPHFEVSVFDGQAARRGEAGKRCPQALRVEPVEVRHVTRMRFAVACDAATEGWQREVIVRAKVTAKVVVMAADVPSGRLIRDEDLDLQARDVTATPDAVSDTSAVVGWSSQRSLRVGQVVSQRMLLTPVLVQRGQSVAIVARNGEVVVNVPGEAMDNGRAGELVRVRNTGSGKVIRARVIGAAKVEPESMPVPAPAQSRD